MSTTSQDDTDTAASGPPVNDRYKWTALTNTTAAVFMSALDGSIVIISMPAIGSAGSRGDRVHPGLRRCSHLHNPLV